MKKRLNRDESQHLIDLGVPKEKASGTFITIPSTDNGSRRRVRGNQQPIFKLEDFLNGEILPKEIECEFGISPIVMTFGGSDLIPNIQEWFAYYDGIIETYQFHAKELIDALYQLACWYYGEYLKSKKK